MTREQKISKIMEIQTELEKLKHLKKTLEKDLEKTNYEFEFHGSWSCVITAESKEEAIKIFYETPLDEYDFSDYDEIYTLRKV